MTFLNDLTNLVPILNSMILLAIGIGAIRAYKSSVAQTTNAAQDRLIALLKDERDQLLLRISELEKSLSRQTLIVETIRTALQKRGMVITIDGQMVTIRSQDGAGTSHIGMDQEDILLGHIPPNK